MKCTCVSTASGWDETNCPYHGEPKKPFIRFRMLKDSNKYCIPMRGQNLIHFDLVAIGIAKVRP